MKIGVISDTHLRQATQELKELMSGPFHDVEMILHAGDITELSIIETFAGKEFAAVCGNMDSPALRRHLPPKRTIRAGHFRIGLIHGWGGPQGIEERVFPEFEKIDCVIYGHTHCPSQNWREGVFLFNPGSFGGGSSVGGRSSVGLLEVGESLSGQIIYV
jgi:uncharacterized protein